MNPLDEPRCQIDEADRGICLLFHRFTSHNGEGWPLDEPPQTSALQEGLSELQKTGAPDELLLILAKYVDFSKLDQDVTAVVMRLLAGHLANRFTAVRKIAGIKKKAGKEIHFPPRDMVWS